MSHIFVRKCVGDRYGFAGREWWYDFGKELSAFDQNAVAKYVVRKQEAYAKLTMSWNDTLNTEWTCRIFFAAKMILAGSVMLSSLEFAKRKNLRICVPYLQYYSLLYSLKSLVLLMTSQRWESGALVSQQTHTKTINVACDEIGHLDLGWMHAKDGLPSVQESISRLKAFRELISYRAPSSGGNLKEHDIDVLPWCRAAVEIAQMCSEILEESLAKHVSPDYRPRLVPEDLEPVYYTNIHGTSYFDDEDHYRIAYLARKHPWPTNIMHIMSEGHVEDFFGSWCDSEDRKGVFDPDSDWQILFDVP